MRKKKTQHKKRAQRTGRWAESIAVIKLVLTGYRISARNWKHALGEIDIIARRGRVLVFVEVKYRHSVAALDYAVSARQWHRIARAASAYVARHRHAQNLVWRFDEIGVSGRIFVRVAHKRDVWRPN